MSISKQLTETVYGASEDRGVYHTYKPEGEKSTGSAFPGPSPNPNPNP